MTDKMVQVKKCTGVNYSFNLDPFTLECLKSCRAKLMRGDKRLSNAVLMRTAIRHYHDHLTRIGSQDLELEMMKGLKTAQGSSSGTASFL